MRNGERIVKKSLATITALVAALALTGCAANESSKPESGGTSSQSGQSGSETTASALSGTFAGAGASAQEAAQASWIAAFQEKNPDVTINYSPVGSGDGRKQFIEGATVYAGSDSYLKDEELEGTFARCADGSKAIDLPVYISPIAVVFNVEGVDALNLDPDTLAKIFKGEISNWNDPAIAALNSDATLPDSQITVVYRSDDSGTTKNFTDYLHATAPEAWPAEAEEAFPGDFAGADGAQGTSGVISSVTNGQGTIGYADASKIGDLNTVALKVGESFVKYSPEGAAAVVDASPMVDGRSEHDLAVKLDRATTAEGAYPLVLVSYLIVCESYADEKDAAFVKDYASFIASEEGQKVAAEGAGSAPISADTRTAIEAAIASIK